MFVYVSIGNSDDNLAQKEWSEFCGDLLWAVDTFGERRHGVWFSNPNSQWQNACYCFEILEEKIPEMKKQLTVLARQYGQESIAWVQSPVTDLIEAASA